MGYLKEETAQRLKVEEMRKAETEDPEESAARLKKQMESLNDTLTVIPNTVSRLKDFAQLLRAFLDNNFQDVTAPDEPPAEGEVVPITNAVKLVLEGRQLLADLDPEMGGDEAVAANYRRSGSAEWGIAGWAPLDAS